MFLTDVFIERLGAKSFSEWLHILPNGGNVEMKIN